jgi:hypothetical protein
MTELPRCITKGQLEMRLQLHRNTVTRLLATGCFPNAFTVNRQWRIPLSDVESFMQRNLHSSTSSDRKEARK